MKKLLQELLKDLNESIERHPKSSTFLCPLIDKMEARNLLKKAVRK